MTLTLNEVIERLYAYDELAADGLTDSALKLEEDLSWVDDWSVVNRERKELLDIGITILGAYEDVESPAFEE